MSDNKSVFVVMSAEVFHPGHLNILKVARELGEVTVGLATDHFNARYKRLSLLSYEDRKAIVENIQGVKRVIPQDTLDLAPVLRSLKPDYFVHGDDWKAGPLLGVRLQVIEILKEWGGELVEPPYTKGVSSTQLNAAWRSIGITPHARIRHFRRMLENQPVVRLLEIHNALTGLIVERTRVTYDEAPKEFDGMWYGRLTDSLAKGKSSAGLVDFTSRVNTLHDVLEGTVKPLVVEAGDGGPNEYFISAVRTLERLGVSAIVIEGLAGSEGAALPLGSERRIRKNLDEFTEKIASGKRALVTEDFSIIPQIRTPLLSRNPEAALHCARAYIESGAGGVMIQGHAGSLDGFFEFCRLYAQLDNKVPLFSAIPATSPIDEAQLVSAGVQVIVYPDQLLRAAYTSMVKTAKSILINSSVTELDELLEPIGVIREFVPGIQNDGEMAD